MLTCPAQGHTASGWNQNPNFTLSILNSFHSTTLSFLFYQKSSCIRMSGSVNVGVLLNKRQIPQDSLECSEKQSHTFLFFWVQPWLLGSLQGFLSMDCAKRCYLHRTGQTWMHLSSGATCSCGCIGIFRSGYPWNTWASMKGELPQTPNSKFLIMAILFVFTLNFSFSIEF